MAVNLQQYLSPGVFIAGRISREESGDECRATDTRKSAKVGCFLREDPTFGGGDARTRANSSVGADAIAKRLGRNIYIYTYSLEGHEPREANLREMLTDSAPLCPDCCSRTAIYERSACYVAACCRELLPPRPPLPLPHDLCGSQGGFLETEDSPTDKCTFHDRFPRNHRGFIKRLYFPATLHVDVAIDLNQEEGNSVNCRYAKKRTTRGFARTGLDREIRSILLKISW